MSNVRVETRWLLCWSICIKSRTTKTLKEDEEKKTKQKKKKKKNKKKKQESDDDEEEEDDEEHDDDPKKEAAADWANFDEFDNATKKYTKYNNKTTGWCMGC